MKIPDQIQKLSGVSQRALARFIGADHTHLSRYRVSTRSLPTAAQSQLTALYNTLCNTHPEIETKLEAVEISQYSAHAAWCRSQCIPLQKQLDTMQLHFKQAVVLMQFLRALRENMNGLSDHQQRWIEEQHYQACRKKKQNSVVAQQKLRIRIRLLFYEAELNEQAAQYPETGWP